jgi:diguanylate cyclase (GGDEF)-like protein/PAS domain S-box-containing protein
MALAVPRDAAHREAPEHPDEAAPALEALCQAAAALCGVQWAILHPGPDALRPIGNGRDAWEELSPLLRHYLRRARHSVVVEDAAADPRFAGSGVGLYAGVPLFSAPRVHVGTLSLMDASPRTLSSARRTQLDNFARIASAHLGMQAELAKAAEKEALFSLLAENSTDMVVRGTLDGARVYLSPAVRTVLGYEEHELLGTTAGSFVHPDDMGAFRVLMSGVREGRVELGVTEHRHRHKDGSWIWVEAFVRLTRDKATNEPDGYVASVRDISRRKEAEVRLAHNASHDTLTGLPNRALLRDRLDAEIARTIRTGAGFALHCLDLDRFKQVNDAHGHQAGDCVLRATADRFRGVVRTEDTVARIGGDEFVVLQTNVSGPTSAIHLANRLIDATAAPIVSEGLPMHVGLSVGIAVSPMAGLDADALLKAADDALYKAKSTGRNRLCVSDGLHPAH